MMHLQHTHWQHILPKNKVLAATIYNKDNSCEIKTMVAIMQYSMEKFPNLFCNKSQVIYV